MSSVARSTNLLACPAWSSSAVSYHTRVGGMPEYVAASTTGFIVPPSDSAAMRNEINRLVDDPPLARRMGRAGHDHVQQYSWRSVAARCADEYQRLLDLR